LWAKLGRARLELRNALIRIRRLPWHRKSQNKNIEAEQSRKESHRNKKEVVVRRARANLRLGLRERAMSDLRLFARDATRPSRRKLAAWDLAVWHLNQASEKDIQAALDYLGLVAQAETDSESLRKIRVMQGEAHYRLGNFAEAREVLSTELLRQEHPDVLLGLANLESCLDSKIHYINRVYRSEGLQEIGLRSDSSLAPYHRLCAPADKVGPLEEQPIVSVIMPAYNSADTASTAIDSVLAQSWQGLEVLVVDDGSTDETAALVSKYCQRDPRVRLIRMENNSGPYVARNVALKEAIGEFVTCNDSDDWSHPQKIEVQVRHLIDNPAVIANTSPQTRAYEDLTFFRRGNPGFYIQPNMSSLMFRRTQLVGKLGYWDSVRFGGDSEYLLRIKKVLGELAVTDLKTGPLSFQLQRDGCLTASAAFGYHGFKMGARREYEDAVKRFHASVKDPYLEFPLIERPFPIPEPMLPRRKASIGKRRHFDVITVSDFRFPGGTSSSNAEEIRAQRNHGLHSGLAQMHIYEVDPSPLNRKIVELIDGHSVEMLCHGEYVSCELLIVRHPWVLNNWHDLIPNIDAKDVRVIINQPPHRRYGPNPDPMYNLSRCAENLRRHFGRVGIWHPIGPLVRRALLNHHADELGTITLSATDWINIIDVDEWKRPRRPPSASKIRIGRHARDSSVKWPSTSRDLLLAYPSLDKYNVRILGGAEVAKRIIGNIPNNWTVLKFNEVNPKEYLADLDVFVYFTHEEWVESFGRVIIEAMAAGVPTILPAPYEQLFKNAALYSKPEEILPIVDELLTNADLYDRQVKTARAFVRKNFGPKKHIDRVTKIIKGTIDCIAV
jgi:glycosyltransferase involved in cell wall biosynthesis